MSVRRALMVLGTNEIEIVDHELLKRKKIRCTSKNTNSRRSTDNLISIETTFVNASLKIPNIKVENRICANEFLVFIRSAFRTSMFNGTYRK